MPREPDPNRKIAFEVYKEHNGDIALVAIAEQLGVTDGTIRGWKSKDKWEDKMNGTFQTKNTERSKRNKQKNKSSKKKSSNLAKEKNDVSTISDSENSKTNIIQTTKNRGAPKGNRNALGNRGGNGAALGNKYALRTGEFETITLTDVFSDAELEIIGFDIDEYAELKQQLKKLMVREYRMFKRIKTLEEIKGGLKVTAITTSVSESTNDDEHGMSTPGKITTVKDVLDEVIRIEDSLTRVQSNIVKVIEHIHKYNLDYERLAIEKERVEIYKNKLSGVVDLDELLMCELKDE